MFKKFLLAGLVLISAISSSFAQRITVGPIYPGGGTSTGGAGSITNLSPYSATLSRSSLAVTNSTNFSRVFNMYSSGVGTNLITDTANGSIRVTNDGFYLIELSGVYRQNTNQAGYRTNYFLATTNSGSVGTNIAFKIASTALATNILYNNFGASRVVFLASNVYVGSAIYSEVSPNTNDIAFESINLTTTLVPGSTFGGSGNGAFDTSQFGNPTGTGVIKDGTRITNIVISGTVTSVGGNARGANANDLQTGRQDNTNVASGAYSFIPGGSNNMASGIYSFAGGYNSKAMGAYSFAYGQSPRSYGDFSYTVGWDNFNYSTLAFIGGGTDNIIGFPTSGDNELGAAIIGGQGNNISNSTAGVIIGGLHNLMVAAPASGAGLVGGALIGTSETIMTSSFATAIGGTEHVITGDYSVTIGHKSTNSALGGVTIGTFLKNPVNYQVLAGFADKPLVIASNGNVTVSRALSVATDVDIGGNFTANVGSVTADEVIPLSHFTIPESVTDWFTDKTEKTSLTGNDLFLIYDSVGGVVKKAKWSNVDTGTGGGLTVGAIVQASVVSNHLVNLGSSGTITIYGTNQSYRTAPSGTITFADDTLQSNVVYRVVVTNGSQTVNFPSTWLWKGEVGQVAPSMQNGHYEYELKKSSEGTNAWVTKSPVNGLAAGWGQALITNSSIVSITLSNRAASIATNALTKFVDFSDTENKQVYNAWFHCETNLVIVPTNMVVGRTLAIYFDTNSVNYDITVTNNYATPTRIAWNFNIATNGSTSFTKTNTLRARVFLTAETNNVITAEMGYYR